MLLLFSYLLLLVHNDTSPVTISAVEIVRNEPKKRQKKKRMENLSTFCVIQFYFSFNQNSKVLLFWFPTFSPHPPSVFVPFFFVLCFCKFLLAIQNTGHYFDVYCMSVCVCVCESVSVCREYICMCICATLDFKKVLGAVHLVKNKQS